MADQKTFVALRLGVVCACIVMSRLAAADVSLADAFDEAPGQGWRFACAKGIKAKGQWVKDAGHGTPGSLYGHNPTQHWACWTYGKGIPVSPGQRYRIACWIKSKPGYAGIRYHVMQVNSTHGPPNTDPDWQLNEWVYTVPRERDSLKLTFNIHGNGSAAWLDDVCVERLSTPGVWHQLDWPTLRNFAPNAAPQLPLTMENPTNHERLIAVSAEVTNFRGDAVAQHGLDIPLAAKAKGTHSFTFPELSGHHGWYALRLRFTEAGEELHSVWQDFTVSTPGAEADREHDPVSSIGANLMPHNSFRTKYQDPGNPEHVAHVEQEIGRLKSLGVNALRLWNRPKRNDEGAFVPRLDLDLVCPIAAAHGMQMTMVLGADATAGGICGANFNRQDLAKYVAWVEWTVKRYGQWVRTVEIANEVKSFPQYVDALRAAYLAVKRLDPKIRVLHAAAYWYHWQRPESPETYLYGGSFWPHLLAFGWPYSEGLNIHEYGLPQAYLPKFLRRYQGVCDRHATGTYAESIWQTECGSDAGVSRPHGVTFPPGLTPQDQAAAAAHQYLITKAAGGPDIDHKALWYLPTDGWGRPIGGWWASGFFDTGRCAKASALAVRTVAEHLRDTTCIGVISTTGRDQAMVFRRGRQFVVAVWASTKTYRTTSRQLLGGIGIVGVDAGSGVTLSLPTTGDVRITDLMGNEQLVPGTQNGLTIEADQYPVLVYGLAPSLLHAAGRQGIEIACDDAAKAFTQASVEDLLPRLTECRKQALLALGNDEQTSGARLSTARQGIDTLVRDLLRRTVSGQAGRQEEFVCLNLWRAADILSEVEAYHNLNTRKDLDVSSAASTAEAQVTSMRTAREVDSYAPKTAAILRLAERRLFQARRASTAHDLPEARARLAGAAAALQRAKMVLAVENRYRLSTWLQPKTYLGVGSTIDVQVDVHNESAEPVRGELRVVTPVPGWRVELPPPFQLAPNSVQTLTLRATSVTGSRRTADLLFDATLGQGLTTTPVAVGLRTDTSVEPAGGLPDTISWRVPWWTEDDGNPWVDGTGARWAMCQLMPGKDAAAFSSYEPMLWDTKQKHWIGPSPKHGHPSLKGERPVMSCSYIDAGHHDPALLFKAPRDGLYTLSGTITVTEYPAKAAMTNPLTLQAGVWDTNGTTFRELYLKQVRARGVVELPKAGLTDIPLKKGQTLLVCRFRIGNRYHYASYGLSNLVLAFRAPPTARKETASTPSPDAYTKIVDGHLNYRGRRLRIWSGQGNLLAADPAHIEAEVVRFAALGFNGHRTPNGSGMRTEELEYIKGDLSKVDRMDCLFAALARHDVFVWSDILNGAAVTSGDVDLVQEPTTREAWLKAVGDKRQRRPIWAVWDKRGEAAYIKQIRAFLEHVNPYNGLRWADDPVFFCWEITNEQWWVQRLLKYAWHLKLPAFFQRELTQQWNEWLAAKYRNDEGLRSAWLGSVLDGESLTESSVLLLPLLRAVGLEQAEVLGVNIRRPEAATYGPRDFSQQRGADVMAFLVELLVAHKQRVYAAMRAVGKPDIGISVVPILFDTGYSFSPQSIYTNSLGDALAVGCYMSQITLDRQHPRFPFRSNLEEPPRLFYDNPWLEQNRVQGKPTFVYETQIFKPAKYRAEYPYLLTMLAAIQDWDVIDWHYYGHPTKEILTDERPFDRMLRPDNRFSWQGVQFKHDEVQLSAMKVAGEMFKQFAYVPPVQPTVMTLGRDSLFDLDMHEWGRLNPMLAPTTYRYGLRLLFAPDAPGGVSVAGPIVHGRQYLAPVIKPTPQIQLDWHTGVLTLDSPAAKAACGFLQNEVQLGDGIRIRDVSLGIPEGMPCVKADEDTYACVGLVATDGQPLKTSKRALLSAVCTSFNTGFTVDTEAFPNGDQFGKLVNHVPTNRIAKTFGTAPVLVARVGLTLEAPCLVGCTFKLLDWHLNPIREGRIGDDGILTISSDEPVFIGEFSK
ncbi:MAG: hypothetical protein HN742_22755 [Lentisphaerae bacterium]|jgi:hypothetical protein|nr:hypothetical protein [Lentisphaerota bacterium]MBT7844716.1 hypothetical protein [Lentisphaerota bacterium]